MSAIPIAVQHTKTEPANPQTHPAASENLDFAAQAMFGLKVAGWMLALLAVILATTNLFIWMSPFWAHWF